MNKNSPKKIPVFDIAIGQQEKNFIKDCLDTSFVGQGPYVKEFENKFSNFVVVNMVLLPLAEQQLCTSFKNCGCY